MIEYDISKIGDVSVQSGIYYLYEDSKLLYIGKAKNLRRRVNQHRLEHIRSKKSTYQITYRIDMAFNRVTKIIIRLVRNDLLDIIEKGEIINKRPPLNKETAKEDLVDFERVTIYNKRLQDVKDWFEQQNLKE